MAPLRTALACLAVGAAALAAGCAGGPPDPETTVYSFEPTRRCIAAAEETRVSTDDLDFVATTALGGAMRVDFPDNLVVLAFGESLDEAARIAQAYRNFAGETISVDDVIRRRGNVVMVWNAAPSGPQQDVVLGCLATEG